MCFVCSAACGLVPEKTADRDVFSFHFYFIVSVRVILDGRNDLFPRKYPLVRGNVLLVVIGPLVHWSALRSSRASDKRSSQTLLQQ